MAELAREGGGYRGATVAPTEISDCFCNLEGETEPASDRSSSRRKNSRRVGITSPMLLHLTPKQLLVARKPTLMDDLITRNKTALLRNNIERTRASKNKRSDLDSDSEMSARKRLRNNEPAVKNSRARKPSDDKKLRVSTRRFMSSLRSGKKRSHIKEASLLERKKRTLKSSGTRSNDSETDTPSSTSSSKPNGHSLERPVLKQVEKNSAPSFITDETKKRKKKPISESKPSGSQIETSEVPIKKVRKKRKKVDSMNWLKKAKQKHHTETKSLVDTKIKSEPMSEPEDSGLGSEMRLDLAKAEDRLSQSDAVTAKENSRLEITHDDGSTTALNSRAGKPVWTILPFKMSPFKQPPNSDAKVVDSKVPSDKDVSLKTDLKVDNVELVLSSSSFESSTLESPSIEPISESLEEPQIKEVDLPVSQPLETVLVEQPVASEQIENDSPYTDSEVVSSLDNDSQDITTKDIETMDFEANSVLTPKLVIENAENDLKVTMPSAVDCDEKISSTIEESVSKTDESDISTLTVDQEESIVTTENVSDVVQDEIIDAIDNNLNLDIDKHIDLPEKSPNLSIDDGNEILQDNTIACLSESDSQEIICDKDAKLDCENDKVVVPNEIHEVIVKEGSIDITQTEDSLVAVSKDEIKITINSDESQSIDNLSAVVLFDSSTSEQTSTSNEVIEDGPFKSVNGTGFLEEEDEKVLKVEEALERQAEKADLLKALGLQSSLRSVPDQLQLNSTKDLKEEKPAKVTEPGYTGTLKAVIKLNKGAPRSIVFKNNEETKPEYQISTEAAASGVPITHLAADVSASKKVKEVVATDFDTVSNSSYVSGAAQSDSGESDEEKLHGKESNLIIPEKSSSFSIHPGRLCCDVCCYCFGKFGSLDTPCHIAQLKGEERQQKILQNEPYLTLDSCLCDACYRYVDRKANCPSSAAAKTAKRARPPAATLCCVTDCTQPATHSVKRKWLLKIKRSLANKVDYYMVCGICRKRLNRNHLYTLGPETDRLNLVLAEDGIPARLSDKLFLCKLCRYYANMRLKYSDPSTIPPSSQPFYTNYRKKILASLDVPVSDSDDDKPKPKEGKDEDVMSLSGLATLLSDQPEPNQPRIQVKFGNVNIGTLSNLNIGQGRQEERTAYDRNEPSNLPLNAAFDFQGPSTSDGSWEKVKSTLQFDKKTKQLWQDLQRPYGNQSSFLRHLVILEKYWRCGYLVLSNSADSRAAKYISSVQTRNKSFEGKSEVKDIKVETPPPSEPSPTPPLQDTILKVPDPSKRFMEESQGSSKNNEPLKVPTSQAFCPIIPTGEVEVLPVNPNSRSVPKEKPASKGTVIIQRPANSGQPAPSQSPCKIMITNVQSLAKPKVDPVLLNRAKSLVRMVSPGVSRQRPPLPVPIQRLPTRVTRPRQFQFMQQPYQTLQAQLQAPPSNHPLQSLQQVVLNRYPPPPLVKINQQMTAQQRVSTPRSQSSPLLMQQQSPQASVSLLPQQQPSVSIIQQTTQPSVSLLQPSVSLIQQPQHSVSLIQQQQQASVSLMHQPRVCILEQQQPSVSVQLQSPSVSLLQQPRVSIVEQQQQPSVSVQLQSPSVSLIQQPRGSIGEKQQPSVSVQLQSPSMSLLQQSKVTLVQNQNIGSQQTIRSIPPPPPYPLRPLLPKLPPSLSISTTPQSTAPSLTPSVSLLPPTSSNGVVPSSFSGSAACSVSMSLPSISTFTSTSHQLIHTPFSTSSSSSTSTSPSTAPSVSVIPTSSVGNFGSSLPSSITLPSSGITIEKQPHNFSSPPILPPEKPIISVFREPLPADT